MAVLQIEPCTCGKCRRCWHQKNGTRLGRQILTGRPQVEYLEGTPERKRPRANPPGACEFLGRRDKDDDGKVMTRHCKPCGKDLEVFTCGHPDDARRALHPLPTLADCHGCDDYVSR